jgi:hypothetical protein
LPCEFPPCPHPEKRTKRKIIESNLFIVACLVFDVLGMAKIINTIDFDSLN